jgi:hypothetical protein
VDPFSQLFAEFLAFVFQFLAVGLIQLLGLPLPQSF